MEEMELSPTPPMRFATLEALQKQGYSIERVVQRINHTSMLAAMNWSEKAFCEELDQKRRLPIGFDQSEFVGSDLTKLRLYELERKFTQVGLHSAYWFVKAEEAADQWLIDNPFLSKQLIVDFLPKHGGVTGYRYFLDGPKEQKKVKTNNLVEAILLGQPW